MEKVLRCECGGNLELAEEVNGVFIHEINSDGTFSMGHKEFYGDSHSVIRCAKCEKEQDVEFDVVINTITKPDLKKIIITEEY